jgi:teichuronic acid biosynthesis glycosyltransferase TuaC
VSAHNARLRRGNIPLSACSTASARQNGHPMNVLVLTNLWPTDSSPHLGSFIVSRVQALSKLGVLVAVCHVRHKPQGSPDPVEPTREEGTLPLNGGRIYVLPPYSLSVLGYVHAKLAFGKPLVRPAARHVIDSLPDVKFGVIHAHGMYLPPAGAVAQRVSRHLGVPYVISLHGSDVNLARGRRAAILRSAVRGAAATSFVSGALHERARSLGVMPSRSAVIPNGVDVDSFSPGSGRSKKCEAGSQIPVVGFLGNLNTLKGADLVPEIVKLVVRSGCRARFVVAGAGELSDVLKRNCEGLPVDIIGRLRPAQVPDYLRGLDLLIVPSRSEGWPTVVLEAHSCGVRVLGSDAGGTPEAIGDVRFVVHRGPDFELRFAKRLIAMIECRADVMELRRRALKFSWTEIASREAEMLDAAVRGRRA